LAWIRPGIAAVQGITQHGCRSGRANREIMLIRPAR
jgi:hypothetical protein